MTVKELIERLKTFPEDAIVSVWDPYYDIPTDEVCISSLDSKVMIADYDFNFQLTEEQKLCEEICRSFLSLL